MNDKQRISFPLAGGCQCNAIRYEISEMPLTLYACHCTECQKQSSSGFGMSMPVPKSGFKVTQGEPKIWGRVAESGRRVNCAFCPECGTRLFHMPTRNDAIVNIKPGTLDDTKWLHPIGHLWIRSAQPWMVIPQNTIRFQTQPDSFESLFREWKNQYKANDI